MVAPRRTPPQEAPEERTRRRFARRQLTWFRADERIQWLNWRDPELLTKALGAVAAHAPYPR